MTTYTPRTSTVRDQVYAWLLRISGRANVQAIDGSPEGVVVGTRGDLVIDTRSATLWIKTTLARSRTGWVAVGGGTGGGASQMLLVGDGDADIADNTPLDCSWIDEGFDPPLTIGARGRWVAPSAGRVRGVTLLQSNTNGDPLVGDLTIIASDPSGTVVQTQTQTIAIADDVPQRIDFAVPFSALQIIRLRVTPSATIGVAVALNGAVDVQLF